MIYNNLIPKTKMTESSIEDWCKRFESLKQMPLSPSSAELLIKVLMAYRVLDIDSEFHQACKKNSVLMCIKSRAEESYDYKLSYSAALLLADWSSGSPGNFVMFISYLQYWCYTNNEWIVNPDVLCRIFPMGIPSSDDLQLAWNWQKCQSSPDNLLDHLECSKSIRKR